MLASPSVIGLVVTVLLSGPEALTSADLLEAGLPGAAREAALREGPESCATLAPALPARHATLLLDACVARFGPHAGLADALARAGAATAPHRARSHAAAADLLAPEASGDLPARAETLRSVGALRAAEHAVTGAVDAASLRARLALLVDAHAWDEARALAKDLRAAGAVDDEVRYALAFASMEAGAVDDAEAWLHGINDPELFARATALRTALAERAAERAAGPSGSVLLAATQDPVDVPEEGPIDALESDAPSEAKRVTPLARPVEDRRRLRVYVRDAIRGAPVDGVEISLRGTGAVGTTAGDGTLDIDVAEAPGVLGLAAAGFDPGVCSFDSFPSSKVTCELMPRSTELAEMVVQAPHLAGTERALAEKRDTRQVIEVVDQTTMRRAGDGDAASALKRVTGITVVGGRTVTVRGLGERYASTTLDGSALPSPEPEKRVVPLDLFPTGALSGVAVQKTWSPELPGEFGGGAVQLRSLTRPERPFAAVSLTLGARGGTTFAEGLRAPGGGLDFLGVDDGTRALPGALRAASEKAPIAERNALTGAGYSVEELEDFGESLQQMRTPTLTGLPPNASLTAGGGGTVQTPIGSLGVVGTAGYGQDWQTTRVERTRVAVGQDGALVARERGVVTGTERTVSLGGLLSTSLVVSEQELAATTLVQRVSDDEARVFDGDSDETGERVRTSRLRWVERTVASQRLSGLHPLPALFGIPSTLSWRYAYALGLRHEPDTREVRYDQDPTSDRLLLSDRPEGNQRMFSDVTDRTHDVGLAWKLPLPIWLEQTATVSVGAAGTTRDREVDTRRYKLLHKGRRTGDPELRARPVESIFTEENIGKDGFLLGETTRPTDNYTGATRLLAAWAQAEVPLAFGITAAGGARVEGLSMRVTTYELFAANQAPVVAALETLDVLPALALTWALFDGFQLRAGASRTVSRPEMRELSPAVFTDVTGGRSRFGNPDLKTATLTHGDLRAEWYPSAGEVVSVGVFGKHFADPIETVVTAGADQSITVQNADSALSVGVELEARKTLGFLHPFLDALSVGGNGALIHSQVTLPRAGIHTTKERALEGQSPWLGNLQVAWDDDALGTHAAILYNVFGPRIVEVGVLGAPDITESAQHGLDVVLSQELAWGFTCSVRATNLVDLPIERTQGGVVVESSTRGRAAFLSLGWRL